MRALPDFLVVGTQKGGTTSLFAHLSSHPRILPARSKETHFFDWRIDRGASVYRRDFPLRAVVAGRRAITGEATPSYMFVPWAARRAGETIPNAKLIFMLRDPVERAWSQYRMSLLRGREALAFADAIRAEPARIDRPLADLEGLPLRDLRPALRFSYVGRGQYAEQIERWLEHFDREQMLFLQSERFFADPAEGYARAVRFLGLPEHGLVDFKPRHVGHDRGPMDPAIRAELAAHFAPWNERLFDTIKTRFDWTTPD